MHLSQLIEFIGHFMGAVLQLILVMMMARRQNKRHSEKIFFTLVAAVFIWHAGNFIITFSELLVGQRIVIAGLVWDTASAVAIGFVPALLIHTLLAFLEEAGDNFFVRHRRLVLVGAYAPLLLFWHTPLRLAQHPELPRAENLMLVSRMFQYWTMAALGVALYMCFTLSRLARDDVPRRFYMSLMRMFAIILGLLVCTHILYAKLIPWLGDGFLVACALAPMFPTIIFSYFILRYNYMEYVLKRSIFYSLLAVFVIAVYILGIRQMGDFLERALNIDFRIIEAILVIGLVLLIEPLREWFQMVFNALFFREQVYYRRVFTELSHRLGSLHDVEVGRLLRYVANSIQAAVSLSNCTIILFREEDGRLVVEEASSSVKAEQMENIAACFRNIHTHSISLWQAADPAIVRELKALEATLVVPIYRDDRLAGIMALGPSTQYRDLDEGQVEILSILLNHLVTALDNTRLMRDKIELERRMFANEKWMSLGRLSGQIAHEVKNPLSSIKAITHVMREEQPPDSQVYKDLSMVESEIDKLADVVNRLLRVGRPASGDERYANLRDIVENVASVLRAEASRNNITLTSHCDDGIPLVKADPVSMREVIFNLMNNGIESMPSGGALSVSVSRPAPSEQSGAPTVVITVHDTGSGISDEDMPRIFEPFFTTKEGGTGLGLWVVREKVTDLGGRITVECDAGTTIRVELPVEPIPPDTPPGAAR
jgi:signal transduction histidine kinase